MLFMDVFNIVRLLRLTPASAMILLFVLNNNTSLELSCPFAGGHGKWHRFGPYDLTYKAMLRGKSALVHL